MGVENQKKDIDSQFFWMGQPKSRIPEMGQPESGILKMGKLKSGIL